MEQQGTPATIGATGDDTSTATPSTVSAVSTASRGLGEPPARSVRVASTVLAMQGLVLAALVVATVVWEDLLISSWASDNPAARAVFAQGGLPALEESVVAVPAFVPIAVVVFLTLVPLGAVLAAMLRSGASWSRSWLTVLAGLGLVCSVLAVRTGAPALFTALAVAAGVSCAVLVAALWHPGTGRWVSTLER